MHCLIYVVIANSKKRWFKIVYHLVCCVSVALDDTLTAMLGLNNY